MTNHPRRQPVVLPPLTDPLAAEAVGPDSPFLPDSMVADISRAVLLDTAGALLVHADGKDLLGVTMAGVVNGTGQAAHLLFLTDPDGAAALVAQVIALMTRSGVGEAFTATVAARLSDLAREGAL